MTMEKRFNISEKDYEAALERGKIALNSPFRATAALYHPTRDEVEIKLTSGARIVFPRTNVKEFEKAPKSSMRALCLSPSGLILEVGKIDAHVNVETLVEKMISLRTASTLGRLGGSKSTEAKRKACVENGKKGGRPRKEVEPQAA
jgi:hypothetical protein